MQATQEALERFRAKVQVEHDAYWRRKYPNIEPREIKLRIGRAYAKVDVGDSGRYMVEMSSGIIYGIKAYGKVHKGHRYGTLETIDDWRWGGYFAGERKQEVQP